MFLGTRRTACDIVYNTQLLLVTMLIECGGIIRLAHTVWQHARLQDKYTCIYRNKYTFIYRYKYRCKYKYKYRCFITGLHTHSVATCKIGRLSLSYALAAIGKALILLHHIIVVFIVNVILYLYHYCYIFGRL